MGSTVYTLFTAIGMPVGVTWSFEWRNVPQGTAYRADASPASNVEGGQTATSQVEVTRFWRRTRVVKTNQPPTITSHEDILGEVKNLGPDPLNYDFLLIAFT